MVGYLKKAMQLKDDGVKATHMVERKKHKPLPVPAENLPYVDHVTRDGIVVDVDGNALIDMGSGIAVTRSNALVRNITCSRTPLPVPSCDIQLTSAAVSGVWRECPQRAAIGLTSDGACNSHEISAAALMAGRTLAH